MSCVLGPKQTEVSLSAVAVLRMCGGGVQARTFLCGTVIMKIILVTNVVTIQDKRVQQDGFTYP